MVEKKHLEEYDLDFSDRFKRKMNRLSREERGFDHAVHPEVDNVFERIRSGIIHRWLVFKNRFNKK